MKGRIVAGGAALVLALVSALLGHFEGLSLRPYRDPIGVLSVCYGHTGNVQQRTYTKDECEALLRQDMAVAGNELHRCITVPMQPNQEAALTSAIYNLGSQVVCGSTLGKLANAGDWPGACAQLSRWVNAGGRQVVGLVRRRAAERALCEGKS